MNKRSDKILCFVRLVCVFFLFGGCGKEEPPPKPKIVSKKIVQKKDVAATPIPSAASVDPPKATPEKPVVAQKTPDMPKPAVEKPADQSKVSADKPPEKSAEKTGDKAEEKSVAKISETAQKPSDKKTDLVFPDISAMEQEVGKAVAALNPKTRVDPFAPLFKEEPKAKPKVEGGDQKPARPKGPLEVLDLSQLKLVGIVKSISGSKALVEEASGKGYIIKKGTFIGIHSGKVSEILDDKIIIEEEQEDYVGNEIDGWTRNITVRKREMKLQKSPGDEL